MKNPDQQEISAPTETGEPQRFLAFALCEEEYAIPLLTVKEVIALPEITPVPHTPAHFLGIMNLRGQVISIVDLRVKFGMKKADRTAETAVIILDIDELRLGVVVNSVDNVLAVAAGDIKERPDIESSVKTDYIQGVTRQDGKLVIILDIARALNVEDFKALKNNQTSNAA